MAEENGAFVAQWIERCSDEVRGRGIESHRRRRHQYNTHGHGGAIYFYLSPCIEIDSRYNLW